MRHVGEASSSTQGTRGRARKWFELASGADLLIHEATFADDLIERAKEDGHSTFSQAAGVAVQAGVKRLILTHISSRYADVAPLLEAAMKVFPNTIVASDLLEVEVPIA